MAEHLGKVRRSTYAKHMLNRRPKCYSYSVINNHWRFRTPAQSYDTFIFLDAYVTSVIFKRVFVVSSSLFLLIFTYNGIIN